jgi:hypothetical protein
LIHDFGSTAKGANGQTASDYFAESSQIGNDSGQFLVTAFGQSEPGHYFVKDQQ